MKIITILQDSKSLLTTDWEILIFLFRVCCFFLHQHLLMTQNQFVFPLRMLSKEFNNESLMVLVISLIPFLE